MFSHLNDVESFTHFKGYLQCLLSFLANISDTVYAIIHVYMKHIYKVLYDISVCLMTFDL